MEISQEEVLKIVGHFELFVLQLFMEILYTRVRHIIAMNQGIQMLNAVWNQLGYSNYILDVTDRKVVFVKVRVVQNVNHHILEIFWIFCQDSYSTPGKTSTGLLQDSCQETIAKW